MLYSCYWYFYVNLIITTIEPDPEPKNETFEDQVDGKRELNLLWYYYLFLQDIAPEKLRSDLAKIEEQQEELEIEKNKKAHNKLYSFIVKKIFKP